MEKPDNVSDNPGLLPYGSNVGAPAIQVLNIEHCDWEEEEDEDEKEQDRQNEIALEQEQLNKH